jgi:hypothetical protein
MKQNYSIYPSMIGGQSGVIWFYNNSDVATAFDDSIPLKISADVCHNLSICLWYISPLQSLNDSSGVQYALLGELNKWTAVSQQRFTSVVTDTQKNEATIIVEGVSGEIVPVVVFHSVLLSVTVNCSISSANGQAHLMITPSNVVCS